jgi:lipopolysaccharide biosynthesis protein
MAFFLTQFHPTPENDEWWGKGFTEWTNVTKAQPLFEGHYQPHLPTDLGFYDLRLRETRREQITIARQHGIDAFCYHYYWFSGTRLLHRPLDDMLADPESDMPFCLCWANENWTRRWDGAESHVLIAQQYRSEDDLEFIKSLIPFFKDPRYVHIDGAPVLLVYYPQHMPDPRSSVQVWREYCASIGIPRLHLICALTHGNHDYETFGFDAGVQFPPHALTVPSYSHLVNLLGDFRGVVYDYPDIANAHLDRQYQGWNVYRCVFPSWDNTARRGAGSVVVLNGTPGNYERWLGEAVRRTRQDFPDADRLVFINAWNEWAEGCHLEPDRKYGRGFLEATLRVKGGRSVVSGFRDVGPPARSPELGLRPAARGLRPMLHRSALLLRKALGLLLLPFPRMRQRAVNAYLSLFSQHA